MIYFISDWHFNHDQEFIWKARGFNSVAEMNEEIIKRHNSVIAEDDDVYVLGDLCMGSNLAENSHYLKQLKGKLHIIYGNHATDNRKNLYALLPNVVEAGYATVIKYKKYRFYLSHYPTRTANYNEGESLKDRTINLCGHIHTSDSCLELPEQLTYHVEVDAHNCYPVSAEEVILNLKHYFNK